MVNKSMGYRILLVDYTFDAVKIPMDNMFDIDTYKILRTYMKTKPKLSLLIQTDLRNIDLTT